MSFSPQPTLERGCGSEGGFLSCLNSLVSSVDVIWMLERGTKNNALIQKIMHDRLRRFDDETMSKDFISLYQLEHIIASKVKAAVVTVQCSCNTMN